MQSYIDVSQKIHGYTEINEREYNSRELELLHYLMISYTNKVMTDLSPSKPQEQSILLLGCCAHLHP